MRERPILFSAPMVRAILAGTKTQTRRAVKLPTVPKLYRDSDWMIDGEPIGRCPYGQPGDRLWVREAFRLCSDADAIKPRDTNAAYRVWYEADVPHQPGAGKLRPSMFMPRWASRILLEIAAVRVERLQDISEADAIAEGAGPPFIIDSWCHNRNAYAAIWEDINGPGSWAANPWCWVVEFKRAAAAA